jgi:hypothetical protein
MATKKTVRKTVRKTAKKTARKPTKRKPLSKTAVKQKPVRGRQPKPKSEGVHGGGAGKEILYTIHDLKAFKLAGKPNSEISKKKNAERKKRDEKNIKSRRSTLNRHKSGKSGRGGRG